jgi:endonuclease III
MPVSGDRRLAAGVIQALREFYGLQPTPPADLFQFLVWEIVSENALPARRDLAWQALKRIPALTPDAMFRAPAKALSDAVGFAGPHRDEKIERIRATVGEFKRHRDVLDVETLRCGSSWAAGRAFRRLTHLPRATRARAYLFALEARVLPIDEDMNRVVARLMGVPIHRNRRAARRWLSAQLAQDVGAFREAVIYLRHHAQQTCLKVAPHCGVCPLRTRCDYATSS